MSNPEDKKGVSAWAIVLVSLFFFLVMGIGLIGMGVYFFKSKTGTQAAQGFMEGIVQKMIDPIVDQLTEGKGELKIRLGEKQEFVFKEKKGGGSFTFKTTGRLPSDFPKDLPIFTPAGFVRNNEAFGINTYTWETKKPAKEVVQFYQTRLRSTGWKTTAAIPSPEEGDMILAFEKGKQTLMLQIASEGKTTRFNLIITEKGGDRK